MRLQFYTITNHPVNSNCHIIVDENKNCLLIDPSMEDSTELISFIEVNKLIPQFIILTHEHFDHCWSVNELRQKYSYIRVIASQICSTRIQKCKTNYSVFYNQVGFEVKPADIVISDIKEVHIWNGYNIVYLLTPGHSEGSMCIYLESLNILVTGDTMIYGEKTVTKLKGGNIETLKESFRTIESLYLDKNPLLLCGHGDSVLYRDYLKDIKV